MIGSLGQPILFLLALGFGLGRTFARAGRGDYVQFLAPGIVMMSILFTGTIAIMVGAQGADKDTQTLVKLWERNAGVRLLHKNELGESEWKRFVHRKCHRLETPFGRVITLASC